MFDDYNSIINEIGEHLGGSSSIIFHLEPCYFCKMFVFSMASYSKYLHEKDWVYTNRPKTYICLVCHYNLMILYHKEKIIHLNKIKNDLEFDYCICDIDFEYYVCPQMARERLFTDTNICKFCDIGEKLLPHKEMIKKIKKWKKKLNKQKDFI